MTTLGRAIGAEKSKELSRSTNGKREAGQIKQRSFSRGSQLQAKVGRGDTKKIELRHPHADQETKKDAISKGKSESWLTFYLGIGSSHEQEATGRRST